jgi:hypothetical protein
MVLLTLGTISVVSFYGDANAPKHTLGLLDEVGGLLQAQGRPWIIGCDCNIVDKGLEQCIHALGWPVATVCFGPTCHRAQGFAATDYVLAIPGIAGALTCRETIETSLATHPPIAMELPTVHRWAMVWAKLGKPVIERVHGPLTPDTLEMRILATQAEVMVRSFCGIGLAAEKALKAQARST